MHFHWKSPEKKRERTFACNFLQLLFVNEWQHEREREREGVVKEEREGERVQTKRKFEGKAAKN